MTDRVDDANAMRLFGMTIEEARGLKREIERLTHLHKLDHSLADQWQAKNEKLEAEFVRLRDEIWEYKKLTEAGGGIIAALRDALEASCVCGAVEAKKAAMIPTGTWEFCIACKALATEAPQ